MKLSIAIAGNPLQRGPLKEAVSTCGYETRWWPVPEDADLPSALIVCLDDLKASSVVAQLRRRDLNGNTSLILFGRSDKGSDHVADMIDLGAELFIEAPVELEELRQWLSDLVGDAGDSSSQSPIIDFDEKTDLHRRLDRLTASTRTRPSYLSMAGESHDDIDLASLGVSNIPHIEHGSDDSIDPADSTLRPWLERSMVDMRQQVRGVDTTQHIESTQPGITRGGHTGTEPGPRVREKTSTRTSVGAADGQPIVERAAMTNEALVTEAGRLEQTELARLLLQLHRSKFTGCLGLFSRSNLRIYFVNGAIGSLDENCVTSDWADDLLRCGAITGTQHAIAAQLLRFPGVSQRLSLIDAGLLKRSELDYYWRRFSIRRLHEAFTWSDGEWTLYHGERGQDDTVTHTQVAQVLVQGVRGSMSEDVLSRYLGDKPVWPKLIDDVDHWPMPELRVDDLALSPAELQAARMMNGEIELNELAAQVGDRQQVLAMAYSLGLLGIVRLLEEETPLSRRGADPHKIDCERIRYRLSVIEDEGCWGVLGIADGSESMEIRRAYSDITTTFADERLERSAIEACATELRQLRAAIERAFIEAMASTKG